VRQRSIVGSSLEDRIHRWQLAVVIQFVRRRRLTSLCLKAWSRPIGDGSSLANAVKNNAFDVDILTGL